MSWPSLLVAFSSLFVLACGSSSTTDPGGLTQPTELAPGQTARVSALSVTFEGVTSDSRCPTDVVCVWEGDAVARLTLTHPSSGTETKELHTSGSGSRSVNFGGIVIELVRLDPAPRSAQPIPPQSYRLTLHFIQVL
jgi:hypothetical protein